MAIDLDDEILQDFLLEAGEILELLGEQLVELERSPQDYELLNAIFRGFHTVKGGAGFLAIEPLVHICHQAEDIFNVLRQGDRQISSELMDVILLVLDVVNDMFEQIRSGEDPDAADPKLLAALEAFNCPEADDQPGAAEEPQMPVEFSNDAVVEQDFAAMLDDALEDGSEPGAALPADQPDDEITEQEFEDLLDELHGKGKFSVQSEEQTVQDTGASASDEITEQEFEELLDQLHGKGRFSPAAAEDIAAAAEGAQEISAGSDEITEDEFEELLDELHGKGKFSQQPRQQETVSAAVPAARPDGQEINAASVQPVTQPSAGSSQQAKATPAEAKSTESGKQKPAEKKAGKSTAPAAETTVRVDTQILDDIMNMVGELVLVRNRFQTLRTVVADEEQIAKAVANLDVVTADLQLAVMKTRMQPIKKVFGRFPRVVRDLARSLKKEITLELQGEDTDLDKNLVEALADPPGSSGEKFRRPRYRTAGCPGGGGQTKNRHGGLDGIPGRGPY